MNFIDTLKAEASTRAANEKRQESVRAHLQGMRLRSVEPKLRQIARYLGALAAHMESAGPDVRGDFTLPAVGTFDDVSQRNYRLTSSADEATFGCTLRFDYVLSSIDAIGRRALHLLTRPVNGRIEGDCLRFRRIGSSARDGRLELEGYVPVTLSFRASDLEDTIEFTTVNLEQPGTRRYLLPTSAVTEALLDEIAKWILRRPHAYRELTGNQVSEANRARLRAQVARHQAERQAQLGTRTPGFVRRIRGWLGAGAQRRCAA